ncbi:MAG: amidase family protein [Burkholderiaceae bacterium]|nr:amidase family protein [Burkholderiaceae bacterium]
MTHAYWRWNATDLAQAIRSKELSAREVTQSVLGRIAEVNPRINALVLVTDEAALAAADAADQAVARGDSLGALHGVPVTIKINVDVAGQATTDGAVALKDNIAATDSPLVKSMRDAGAIIVGRSNAPAFSLRWFADNDLHGRTLNPFDAGVTPGGSSGGAAAAVAMGMGPIAHGNDYGGSIRYPAWACGVVGLRTTVGRVPSYKASAPNRIISNQQMSVQGPLTRSVADARLALQVMSQGTPLDPQWVPAPIDYPGNDKPVKVALFKQWSGSRADPSVVAALEQAAQWLADAGYEVEETAPPHFAEMGDLYRHLVMDDMRRAGFDAMMKMGDAALRQSLTHFMGNMSPWNRDQYLDALVQRFNIARDWAVFSEQYPVMLMPNSWERQFPIDDDLHSQSRFEEILLAQTPLLSTALLGLPGLSVPTGIIQGLPVGVQIVTGRFREDLALRAGAVIEDAARFSALDLLAP